MAEELLLAPAKVNLFLHILGRRADGYHLLDSLMVPVSLYDELRLRVNPSPTSSISLACDAPALPCGPTNLAYRAAALFLETTRLTAAVDISLAKRIPMGGGLGGGSSDAAAVLLGLNRLLGAPLNPGELATLAGRLGADVTFFAYGRPARVGGIGEQVVPVDLPAVLSLVLCTDGFALSTQQVYARVDLASLTSHEPVTNISELVDGRRLSSKWFTNDLEKAAAEVHPEVLSLKSKLVEQGALGALMTGSGSAVFGVWPDPQLARDAATRLRQQGVWAESVVTVNRSPAVRE
jgi:4-diphosphocytidyl-2-C-methyl-D-erythritol kinase